MTDIDLKTAVPVIENSDGTLDTDTNFEITSALPADLTSTTKTWSILAGERSPEDTFDRGLETVKAQVQDLAIEIPKAFDQVFTKPVKDILHAETSVAFPALTFMNFVRGVLGAGEVNINKPSDAFTKIPIWQGMKSIVTGQAPNTAESLVKNFHVSNPYVADMIAGVSTLAEAEVYFGAISNMGEVVPKAVQSLKTSYINSITRMKNKVLDSVREGYKFQNPDWTPEVIERNSLEFFRKLSKEGVGGFKVNTENPFSLMRSVNDVRTGFKLKPITPEILYSDITGAGFVFNSKEMKLIKEIASGAKLELEPKTLKKIAASLGLKSIDTAEAMKHMELLGVKSKNETPTAKGGEILYHETGSNGLDYLLADADASGLNVSTDKSLALGQGGKGILVELDKDKLLGTGGGMGQGSLRPIKKPSTDFVGQKEFEVVGGRTRQGVIKSITIKEGTPVTKVQKAILNRQYDKVVNGDGSITFTPKLSPKEGGKVVEPPKVAETPPTTPKTPIVEEVSGKERGFVSSVKGEMPELGKVAGQYIPRSTDELAVKARTLIQEDIKTAESMAKTGTDDASIATGAELLKYYVDEAEKVTGLAKEAIYEKATELANSMAERLTELGRSVQAASILTRLTPEGQLKFAAKTIQKYNEKMKLAGKLDKMIPDLTPEQTKDIIDRMGLIQKMPEGEAKAIAFQELQNTISDLVPTPLMDKIIAVWKAGLLSGLKTTGLNMISNAAHIATLVASDLPSALIDMAVSVKTGKRAVVFNVKGYGEGFKEGYEKGLRFLKTGYDERNVLSKLDYKRVNMGTSKFAKGLQKYEEFIFKAIGSQDQPFYYGAKLRSLYGQAKVEALNKGLRGEAKNTFIKNLVENPTDDMVLLAIEDAKIAVYQNDTALGDIAKGVQNLGKGAFNFILPFGKTPSAVATQIVNYTPVGAVKTLVQNWGKNFNQKDFSEGLGKALGTGLAALGLGGWLYKQGMMTLERPTNEAEQKLWEMEGKQANSIKIGGAWRTIMIGGPIGNVLLIGGHYVKGFEDTGSLAGAFVQGSFGATKSFTEQTMLKSVSGVLDAVSDPKRSAMSFVNSFVGSAVPTLVKDVAVGTDTKARRVSGPIEALMERLPVLRYMLEPKVDTFGQDVKRTNNFLESMADPTRPSKIKNDPVVTEIRRLVDAKQEVKTGQLGKRLGYTSLTPKQNTELWQKAGQDSYEKIAALIDSYAGSESMPDERKAERINKIIADSNDKARLDIILEATNGLEGDALISKLKLMKKENLLNETIYKKFMRLR